MPTVTKDKVAPAILYLESSAVVAGLLEADAAARVAMRRTGRRVTSTLTIAEAQRAILRARLMGRLTSRLEKAAQRGLREFARRCEVVSITDAILERAGREFPIEPIRTLDAIHLASVEALGEAPSRVVVVTRDARVRENALALGYGVE